MSDFLLAVFDVLFCWLPRMEYLPPDTAGVHLRGKKITAISPGTYKWWIPFLDEVRKTNIMPLAVRFRSQAFTNEEGKTLVVSGGMMYEVADASKALVCVEDYEDSVLLVGLGAISEHFRRGPTSDPERAIIDEIRKITNPWGIRTKRFWLFERANGRVLRHLIAFDSDDSPYADDPESD